MFILQVPNKDNDVINHNILAYSRLVQYNTNVMNATGRNLRIQIQNAPKLTILKLTCIESFNKIMILKF